MKVSHLALFAVVAGFGMEAAANPLVPNVTVDIAFTGFCDGMHLVIDQGSGLVRGHRTGCLSGGLIGTVGSNSKLGAGITVFSDIALYVIDNNPQVFVNYLQNGTQINSGGYTVGAAAVAGRSGRPSTR